eukprot:SM000073S21489  [mRNA]  locus=s73:545398:552936:- [translate_table: standard]
MASDDEARSAAAQACRSVSTPAQAAAERAGPPPRRPAPGDGRTGPGELPRVPLQARLFFWCPQCRAGAGLSETSVRGGSAAQGNPLQRFVAELRLPWPRRQAEQRREAAAVPLVAVQDNISARCASNRASSGAPASLEGKRAPPGSHARFVARHRDGRSTPGLLSRQRQRQEDSSLDVALVDRHVSFFLHGPRVYRYAWTLDDAARRAKLQHRRLAFVQQLQVAKRIQDSLEYYKDYVVPPGRLPNAVISVPLVLAQGDRLITIITTACLPWLTGTSINPLLRGAYLEQHHNARVTLLFPWIPCEQQVAVYGRGSTFESQEQQAAFVRAWIEKRLSVKTKFRIQFYDAQYDPRKRSIMPTDRSDITVLIHKSEADVAVLEEPEHLCWYHFIGPRWRTKFKLVVGVAHTNYIEYIRREPKEGGPLTAIFVWLYNIIVVRANCHVVIRLSRGVQQFAHSVVCNIHGVAPQFLKYSCNQVELAMMAEKKQEVAEELRAGMPHIEVGPGDIHLSSSSESVGSKLEAESEWKTLRPSRPTEAMQIGRVLSFSRGAYFIGKVLWGKGYEELCKLLSSHCERFGYPSKPPDSSTSGHHDRMQNGTAISSADLESRQPQEHTFEVEDVTSSSQRGENGGHESTVESGSSANTVGGNSRVWIDIYGSGSDEDAVMAYARKQNLPLTFHGRKDHADPIIAPYKVFVNAAVSDVLCTTTAEAIAMGKFVVITDHPSNEFFKVNFPENCITYDPNRPEDFSRALCQALKGHPAPLSAEQRKMLTWEAVTIPPSDRAIPGGRWFGMKGERPIKKARQFLTGHYNYACHVRRLDCLTEVA